MFAPSKARQAFNAAQQELESAIAKYNDARATLQRETGEFIATDRNIAHKFTAATGIATGQYKKTDC